MAASASVPDELDERVLRVVHRLLREEPHDEWLDSAGACSHLKLSKHHFLRMCRAGDGPKGSGDGRLKRWRRSTLDVWQEGRRHV